MKEIIEKLVSGKSLTMEQASEAMKKIMDGEVNSTQFGAFVAALRLKGETVEEIAGMANTMRSKAIPVAISEPVIDTCGTGGDGLHTFNFSTAAAFVAAGGGLKVAKHGNRAMSSNCGSADILEAVGVKIDLPVEKVKECIEKIGIGFMFAPSFHPAMKYAAIPRRELGIPTVFNILGPLTNPARVSSQVVGVSEGMLLFKIAEVLKILGCHHALVAHGEDGMDEVSLCERTLIVELKNGSLRNYSITPEDLGLKRVSFEKLRGGTAKENAKVLVEILSGAESPLANAVLLNAAAAFVAGDKATDFREGLEIARESLRSGSAFKKLQDLVKIGVEYASKS